MRNQSTDTQKRPVNLSINAQTLEQAKKLGINLSKTVDAFLREEVKRLYWQKWNEENALAIDHYNARIEREGLPLAKYRTF